MDPRNREAVKGIVIGLVAAALIAMAVMWLLRF